MTPQTIAILAILPTKLYSYNNVAVYDIAMLLKMKGARLYYDDGDSVKIYSVWIR